MTTCFHSIFVFWVHFSEKSAILVLGAPTDHVRENLDFFLSFYLEPIKLIQLGGTPLKLTIFFSTTHL